MEREDATLNQLEQAVPISEYTSSTVALMDQAVPLRQPDGLDSGTDSPEVETSELPAVDAVEGLSSQVAINGFVAKARELHGVWAEPGSTKHSRANHLHGHANQVLDSLGIPTTKQAVVDTGDDHASFTPSDWTVNLDQHLFGNEDASVDEIEMGAESVWHESRHAEQNYWAARWAAGQGHSGDTIAKQWNIESTVAKQAVQDPLGKDDAQPEGLDQWVSEFFLPEKQAEYYANRAKMQEVMDDIRAIEFEVDLLKVFLPDIGYESKKEEYEGLSRDYQANYTQFETEKGQYSEDIVAQAVTHLTAQHAEVMAAKQGLEDASLEMQPVLDKITAHMARYATLNGQLPALYETYRNVAVEADAHEVGEQISAQLKQPPPLPA